MKKFCKKVLDATVAVACIAAISATTLFLKSRYDAAVESATQARLTEMGFGPGLKLPAVGQTEERPGRKTVKPSERDLALTQSIIDDELRDASPEEREIWSEELKDRPPEEIREILSLRHRFAVPTGSKADSDFEFPSADRTPPRILPEFSTAEAARIPADSLALIASSIEAVQTAEQVILNNIANANTIGFKRSRVLFGDTPYRDRALPGQIDELKRSETSGLWRVTRRGDASFSLGSGTFISGMQFDMSPGRLQHTKQLLDLAIEGQGYFQVSDGDRFLYTRVGSFTLDSTGQLVLTSKDSSRPIEPAITIPQVTSKITISRDGIVSVLQAGQTEMNQIGNIQLTMFVNPAGLVARGDGLFAQSSASGNPIVSTPGQDGLGKIRQEYLEESNVSIVDELTELRHLREQLKALRQLHSESHTR